ncbi:MAG: histidinol phosphate phosphatase domain-containing protein [Nitrospinota bacterium]|nr:histidinol phosphate phosphatase domain-containing protein [Nitrospinota bacterium]
MIDLHTHTIFSDGELLPNELAIRAESMGLKILAITDHVDSSNLDFVIPRIVKVCSDINKYSTVRVIPGAEITHVNPNFIGELAAKARSLGAKVIIAHGETIVEPVVSGTNRAALEADIDILAHPGLISETDVSLAKERGIFLEITGRKGHSLTNGHVASLASKIGAKMSFGSDSHSHSDLVPYEQMLRILKGAGLGDKEVESVFKDVESFTSKII